MSARPALTHTFAGWRADRREDLGVLAEVDAARRVAMDAHEGVLGLEALLQGCNHRLDQRLHLLPRGGARKKAGGA